MTDPALVPQPYPLWCAELDESAELDDDAVSAGRVVAWRSDGFGALLPVVAWENADTHRGAEAVVVDGETPWFLGESRAEAIGLAESQRQPAGNGPVCGAEPPDGPAGGPCTRPAGHEREIPPGDQGHQHSNHARRWSPAGP